MKKKSPRPVVLLVDDYPDAREMYAEYLEFSGFDVVEAGNGQEALDRALDRTPDVILMDLSLPVMDGWEATRQLKSALETRGIPIIALTAHAMPSDEQKAREAGCDDFDTKPIELARLLDKITARLDGKKPG
jgi:two-component system, cell cycle response regulator DivK